jgi:hypothetical protein
VSPPTTCSMEAISVTNNSVSSILTVSTVGPQSALATPTQNGMRLALELIIPAMLLSGSVLNKPRRRRVPRFCLLLLALSSCGIGVACGSGGQSTQSTQKAGGNTGTPAGTYSVLITAEGSGVTHTASVSLSVQ